jgi:hypothetical protein
VGGQYWHGALLVVLILLIVKPETLRKWVRAL